MVSTSVKLAIARQVGGGKSVTLLIRSEVGAEARLGLSRTHFSIQDAGTRGASATRVPAAQVEPEAEAARSLG